MQPPHALVVDVVNSHCAFNLGGITKLGIYQLHRMSHESAEPRAYHNLRRVWSVKIGENRRSSRGGLERSFRADRVH